MLGLAPDSASQRTAERLAGQLVWSGAGAAGDLVWGACAGSGARPYQIAVDLSGPAGPAYRCSCPSRKFPCKHALGLLLNWARDAVPEQAEAAEFAREWQAGRAGKVGRAKSAVPRDPAAAARRSQQRADRVRAGLAELQTWLRDQVRAGLSTAAGGYGHAEAVAARMVDAQAPGVAGMLRRLSPLPVSGDGWPGRLLAEYAQLHLLTRAYAALDELPPPLAATVRSRVGFTTSRDEVLAGPAVTDHWLVLGRRDLLDAAVPARRIWLRGRAGGRFALLLSFAVGGAFGASPDAGLAPGTQLHADLHFYPGQAAVRAVVGVRHGEPAAAAQPDEAEDVAGLLDRWAAALGQDPWLTEWPALLAGVPVPDQDRWRFTDGSGRSVPLLGPELPWPLLAVSGGYPVALAGEWSPAGLTPLTVWHGDQAVLL
ncbi:MAG TPA: SWIM zinc finger family protein [Streptosporangiaceae bacterium]|nr:SWIM zinc finger family protein [Streptosporangiaceae bacterium]